MLLTDDAEQSTATTANLPTNEDVLKALKTQNTDVITESNEVAVNRLVIVMWADDMGQYCWYVGYLTRDQEGKLIQKENTIHQTSPGDAHRSQMFIMLRNRRF